MKRKAFSVHDSLKKPVNPRVLRLLVLLTFSVMLLPINGWFTIVLYPLAVHIIVGFKLTTQRDTLRAYIAPSMLFLPLCLGLWIRSHQVMSYALVSVGGNEFVGVYIFPSVIEIGWYEHDPAGLKYLEQGITPEIANVMTDIVRRFQVFEGSDQVFDCICIVPMYCRNIPVVDGWFSLGTIYAGLHPDGWTPGSFYLQSGPWTWRSVYQTSHVGFHFLVPLLVATISFVRGIHHWRIHERRLRTGECIGCGYNLLGNTSGKCPECGTELQA